MTRHTKLKSLKQQTEEQFEKGWEQTMEFANAILEKDLRALDSLLHEEFTYFNTKSKTDTIQYFKDQFEKHIPEEVFSENAELFFCRACQPGNPAVQVHHGYFPVMEDEKNLPKVITLNFKDEKISDLTLCYDYCDAEEMQEIIQYN